MSNYLLYDVPLALFLFWEAGYSAWHFLPNKTSCLDRFDQNLGRQRYSPLGTPSQSEEKRYVGIRDQMPFTQWKNKLTVLCSTSKVSLLKSFVCPFGSKSNCQRLECCSPLKGCESWISAASDGTVVLRGGWEVWWSKYGVTVAPNGQRKSSARHKAVGGFTVWCLKKSTSKPPVYGMPAFLTASSVV